MRGGGQVPLEDFLEMFQNGYFKNGYSFFIVSKNTTVLLKRQPVGDSSLDTTVQYFKWRGVVVNQQLLRIKMDEFNEYMKMSTEDKKKFIDSIASSITNHWAIAEVFKSYGPVRPGDTRKWFHAMTPANTDYFYEATDLVVEGEGFWPKKDVHQLAMTSYAVTQKKRDTPAAKQAFSMPDIVGNIASFLPKGSDTVIDHSKTAELQLARLQNQRQEMMEQIKQLNDKVQQLNEEIQSLNEYLHRGT